MPNKRQFQKHIIVFLYQEGLSQRAISKKLGISRHAIQSVIAKLTETGQRENRKLSGRPQKLSKSHEQFLKVTSLRNKKKTSQQLAQDLRDASGPSVDSSAGCRSLIRNGLNGSMAVTKPFLRKGNREKRVKCAKNYKTEQKISGKMSFGVMNQNFEIFGSHRCQYVRRRPGKRYNSECLQPSIKHGGDSVMVLGCVSASSAEEIVKIDGIMNAEKYHQLLSHHALPSAKRLIGNGFIFLHGNDPKHTADAVKAYLQRKVKDGTPSVLDCPPPLPQSPDLNIIEAVWDHLDRELNKRQPTSKEKLQNVLQEAWQNIPADYLHKLHVN